MWFARQYDEYIGADRKWRNGEYDRIATGNAAGHAHSDPTANEAMRLTSSPWAWKIAAIKQAAVLSAPGFCDALLKNIAQDLTWECIGPPVARKQFYEARRKFYLELHLMLENR